jgi:hypothetical protein
VHQSENYPDWYEATFRRIIPITLNTLLAGSFTSFDTKDIKPKCEAFGLYDDNTRLVLFVQGLDPQDITINHIFGTLVGF